MDDLFKSRSDLLPAAAHWAPFYDQARFVASSVHGTEDAILIGVLLAALVLFGFLQRWRTTLVASAAIPITVAIVGIALGFFHQTVNLMTLAGVAAAIGLVADDAIVVVEDIERRRDAGEKDPAGTSVHQRMPALIGSSLSTVIIFIPFAALPGITGAFFKPLALTMSMALAISFFVAVIGAPVAIVWLEGLGRHHEHHPPSRRGLLGSRRAGGSSRAYDRVSALFVDHGVIAVAALAVLIGTGWYLYRDIGTDFLPGMDEGSIILDYWTPPGTSLTDTDAMLNEVEKVIMSLPDVDGYSRRTGTQLGFFVTEANTGDFVINLKPQGRAAAGGRRHRRPARPHRAGGAGDPHGLRPAHRGRHRRPHRR